MTTMVSASPPTTASTRPSTSRSSRGDASEPFGRSNGESTDGGFGGAPASQDEDLPASGYVEAGIAEGQGLNSSLAFGYEGAGECQGQRGASDGAVDCYGQPSNHECDKGGSLTLGPLSVAYVGDNCADDDDTRFGSGDEFVVSGGGPELLVGFDCDFTTSPSRETRDFDLGSSKADPPGQFGPEDGESSSPEHADDEPGDERSETGEENGQTRTGTQTYGNAVGGSPGVLVRITRTVAASSHPA